MCVFEYIPCTKGSINQTKRKHSFMDGVSTRQKKGVCDKTFQNIILAGKPKDSRHFIKQYNEIILYTCQIEKLGKLLVLVYLVVAVCILSTKFYSNICKLMLCLHSIHFKVHNLFVHKICLSSVFKE